MFESNVLLPLNFGEVIVRTLTFTVWLGLLIGCASTKVAPAAVLTSTF